MVVVIVGLLPYKFRRIEGKYRGHRFILKDTDDSMNIPISADRIVLMVKWISHEWTKTMNSLCRDKVVKCAGGMSNLEKTLDSILKI